MKRPGWLQRLLGKQPEIPCPKCEARSGRLLSRTIDKVTFHEVMEGGWAGHTQRPMTHYKERLRCAACGHQWTRIKREF